jgi:hypothetical protein
MAGMARRKEGMYEAFVNKALGAGMLQNLSLDRETNADVAAIELRDLLAGRGVIDFEGVIQDGDYEEDTAEASVKPKKPATKKGILKKKKKTADVRKDLPSPTGINEDSDMSNADRSYLSDISMTDNLSSG